VTDHAITCGVNGLNSFICLWCNTTIVTIGRKVRFHHTLHFMTKQRGSSAAATATSRLPQKFGIIDTSVSTSDVLTWRQTVADPGGGSLGQLPPQTSVAPPWMAPLCHKCAFFGAHGSRNRNNVFCLVKLQGLRAGFYPTSYGIAWTILLFCKFHCFVFSLPRENCPAFTNAVTFAFLDLLLCCMEMVCFFYKLISLMPDDRLETKRKGSSKNRNAIWKTYYWLKILPTSKMKTKTQFQGYCQCSSWVRSLSAS